MFSWFKQAVRRFWFVLPLLAMTSLAWASDPSDAPSAGGLSVSGILANDTSLAILGSLFGHVAGLQSAQSFANNGHYVTLFANMIYIFDLWMFLAVAVYFTYSMAGIFTDLIKNSMSMGQPTHYMTIGRMLIGILLLIPLPMGGTTDGKTTNTFNVGYNTMQIFTLNMVKYSIVMADEVANRINLQLNLEKKGKPGAAQAPTTPIAKQPVYPFKNPDASNIGASFYSGTSNDTPSTSMDLVRAMAADVLCQQLVSTANGTPQHTALTIPDESGAITEIVFPVTSDYSSHPQSLQACPSIHVGSLGLFANGRRATALQTLAGPVISGLETAVANQIITPLKQGQFSYGETADPLTPGVSKLREISAALNTDWQKYQSWLGGDMLEHSAMMRGQALGGALQQANIQVNNLIYGEWKAQKKEAAKKPPVQEGEGAGLTGYGSATGSQILSLTDGHLDGWVAMSVIWFGMAAQQDGGVNRVYTPDADDTPPSKAAPSQPNYVAQKPYDGHKVFGLLANSAQAKKNTDTYFMQVSTPQPFLSGSILKGIDSYTNTFPFLQQAGQSTGIDSSVVMETLLCSMGNNVFFQDKTVCSFKQYPQVGAGFKVQPNTPSADQIDMRDVVMQNNFTDTKFDAPNLIKADVGSAVDGSAQSLSFLMPHMMAEIGYYANQTWSERYNNLPKPNPSASGGGTPSGADGGHADQKKVSMSSGSAFAGSGLVNAGAGVGGAFTALSAAATLFGAVGIVQFTNGMSQFGFLLSFFGQAAQGNGMLSPFIFEVKLGAACIGAALSFFFSIKYILALLPTLLMSSFWAKCVADIDAATVSATSMYNGPMKAMFAIVLVSGVILIFFVPLMPFLVFLFAILGWVVLVIEAVLAGTMVPVIFMHKGEDFIGRGETAMFILLSCFARPTLLVFGMACAMFIAYVGLTLLNAGFMSMLATAWDFSTHSMFAAHAIQSNVTYAHAISSGAGLVDDNTADAVIGGPSLYLAPAIVFVYSVIAYQLVEHACSVITTLPDKITRWVGAPGEQSDAMQYAKGASGAASQALGGAISHHTMGEVPGGASKEEDAKVDDLKDNKGKDGDGPESPKDGGKDGGKGDGEGGGEGGGGSSSSTGGADGAGTS